LLNQVGYEKLTKAGIALPTPVQHILQLERNSINFEQIASETSDVLIAKSFELHVCRLGQRQERLGVPSRHERARRNDQHSTALVSNEIMKDPPRVFVAPLSIIDQKDTIMKNERQEVTEERILGHDSTREKRSRDLIRQLPTRVQPQQRDESRKRTLQFVVILAGDLVLGLGLGKCWVG
jgi:hypothetical protein